jgi:hypothetical protein
VRAPQVARQRVLTAAGVYGGLLALVVSHAATGWMASIVPSLHRADPAFELLEYRSLRDTLNARGLLQPAAFVATTDWLRGAKIGYALGPARPTLVLNDDARHFPFASDIAPLVGRDGLLLMKLGARETEVEMWGHAEPFIILFDTLRYVGRTPVLRGADTALLVAVFSGRHLRQGWPPRPLPTAPAPAVNGGCGMGAGTDSMSRMTASPSSGSGCAPHHH